MIDGVICSLQEWHHARKVLTGSDTFFLLRPATNNVAGKVVRKSYPLQSDSLCIAEPAVTSDLLFFRDPDTSMYVALRTYD
ncbi:MAG: hypothetical protein BMS9Abin26_0384 [Gammaproteobacteria bacterium]|nr:MAG: hypothetical protein BMS9Abin26_0384 [Gammaproteobacteria bacterium]